MVRRSEGRLTSRAGPSPSGPASPGLHRLTPPEGGRDALLGIPPEHGSRPAPLAVMLHGAGGTAEGGLRLLWDLAQDAGVVVLAPQSIGRTWDALIRGYGPDVAAIDHALTATFTRCAVDPDRIAVGGFSDGASYALSIGITNGDLFSEVLAFSPGFAAPAGQEGRPRLFISHGIRDEVLPVDRCSRRLVPRLRRAGYQVEYDEFDGPHTVPDDVKRRAVQWWLEG